MARPERSRRLRRCVTLLLGTLTLGATLATVLAARPPAAGPHAPVPPPPAHPAAPPAHAPDHGPTGGPFPMPPELVGVDLNKQTDADVHAKSDNCLACHCN